MDLTSFRVLADATPDALLLLDADGRVLAASPSAEHLLPLLASAGPQVPLADLVADDGARITRMLELCGRTSGALLGTLSVPPAAGADPVTLRCRLVRSHAPGGSPRTLVGVEPPAVGHAAVPDAAPPRWGPQDEQEALHRVARAVAESIAPERLFDLVSQEVAGLLGVEAGTVWRFEGPISVAVGSWGDHLTLVGSQFPLQGTGALPQVWTTNRPARAAYTELPDDDPTRRRVGRGFLVGVAAPVRSGGRVWGAVLAATTRADGLPDGAEERLGRFAELVGLAITNIEDRRVLAQQAAEQGAVGRVATAVAAGREPDEIFELVCREAARLTGAAAGGVVQVSGPDEGVVRARWSDGGSPTLAVGTTIPLPTALVEASGRSRTARRTTRGDAAPEWRRQWGDSLSVTILDSGTPWGVVSVAAGPDRPLRTGAEERISTLAELAGVAIANAENRRDVSRRVAEQTALRRVARAVAAEPELDEVLALICHEAALLLGVPSVGVMRALDDGRQHTVAAWTADGPPPPAGHPVEDAVAGAGPPEWQPEYAELATCPIVIGEEAWGTIGAAGREGRLDAAGEALLVAFADLAGVAVANDELRRRSVDEAAALISGGALDMPATLRAIASSGQRALHADRVTCAIFREDGSHLDLYSTETDPAQLAEVEEAYRERSASAFWHQILQGADTMVEFDDVRAAIRSAGGTPTAATAASAIAVRLESRGAVLGVVTVSHRTVRRFTPRDRAALRSLASVAELAIANAREHGLTLETLAEAERRAATDPLTGLANHRAFHERLRDEVERARRHGRALALVVFDLDHFKDTNDRHGHQVGDAILVEVAQRLTAQARPEDLVARLGGEEFAWLLPESDSLDAWKAAERAREAVRGAPFALGERCTLSAGIAELAQARDAGDLVRLADGALYWAKAHGRDVSFRYSPEVVAELSADERANRLERSQALSAIRVLARAVDAKDPSTRQHSERVADLADLIAGELGWSAERRLRLRGVGVLHDVGKIGVPDSILFKPGPLTREEYEQVKQHAGLGAQIVADVLTPEQVGWLRWHHERMDGSGYPDGLSGDEIPDGARILAVADAWDVMTSLRIYSLPISAAEAVEECRRAAGSQFCPPCVAALERLVRAGEVVVAEPV